MSIDRFLAVMNANGGMSMSNNFLVKLDVPKMGDGGIFNFLCDEAQLPNVNAATGTLKGRYLGEGQVNYPHTRVFTEMQLGFQCDARMTPLLFLNEWFGKVFPEYATDGGGEGAQYKPSGFDRSPGSTPYDARTIKREDNRTVRLNYPDVYCGNIYVTKTELGTKRDGGLRTSVTYVMERAWPFAIDAVPLQYGSAQITKVTAQFYYSKHRLVYHDLTDLSNKDLLPDFDDPTAPDWYRGKYQP